MGTDTVAAWIVVNIGCIECGVSSNIVGVFTDKTNAVAQAERLQSSHSWREGGQNAYDVFPLPAFDIIHPDYLDKGGA